MNLFSWSSVTVAFLTAHLLVTAATADGGGAGYVVLGDSIEAGLGASDPEVTAYVPLFHQFLQSVDPGFALHNVAVPGATVRDIKQDQLAQALAEIESHTPVVIAWGGGGNDLLNFIGDPEAVTCLRGDASCIRRLNALLNEVEQTVKVTLAALRAAAPADTPILVRTQYNPLLKAACGGPTHPQAQLASVVLEGGVPGLARGMNDRLRDQATAHGARVVEIFLPFFLNPDGLIAGDCIHPNDAGHLVIFDATVLVF
jgi:lysophospholipase L1-like esterase